MGFWHELHHTYSLIKQDAQRWVSPGEIARPEEVTSGVLVLLLFRYLPLRAMAWYRFSVFCKQRRIPLLNGMIIRLIYQHYGLEIGTRTEIAGGLYIPHPIGTVINVHRMGENCSIIASVTIGMRKGWDFPRIGDNVFIGAGARVLGDIVIGDNAIIGANAVVIDNVPAGSTAVGIPAQLVRSNYVQME